MQKTWCECVIEFNKLDLDEPVFVLATHLDYLGTGLLRSGKLGAGQ